MNTGHQDAYHFHIAYFFLSDLKAYGAKTGDVSSYWRAIKFYVLSVIFRDWHQLIWTQQQQQQDSDGHENMRAEGRKPTVITRPIAMEVLVTVRNGALVSTNVPMRVQSTESRVQLGVNSGPCSPVPLVSPWKRTSN